MDSNRIKELAEDLKHGNMSGNASIADCIEAGDFLLGLLGENERFKNALEIYADVDFWGECEDDWKTELKRFFTVHDSDGYKLAERALNGA